MGEYSDLVLGGGTKEYVESLKAGVVEKDIASMGEPAKEQSLSITEMVLGTERATEQTRTLPEYASVRQDVNPDLLKQAAGFLFSLSDEDAMDVIKKSVPEAKFINDEKGNVLVDINGNLSVLNKPGFSKTDASRATAQLLAFLPVNKAVSLGKGVLQKIGIGAAGSALTEAGLQEVEQAAGVTKPREAGRIMTAGATGGAAEAVGPAYRWNKQRRQAKRLNVARQDIPVVGKNITEANIASKEAGIDLSFPQKTAIPSQLEEMSFISQLPAGTQRAMGFLKKQNKQASNAVEAFLNYLAPEEIITTGAEKFRTAAQRAVGAAKEVRKKAVSPIYKKAFKQGEDMDTKELTKSIISKMSDYPKGGEVSKTLGKIRTLLKGSKKGGATLKKLHNTKLEIDQMLASYGENSLGNTTKKEVLAIKESLLDFMDEASPAYKQAREEFSRLSPGVDKIQNSIVGKVADVTDVQLKGVSRKIFDPAETNTKTILNAKKIISAVDPDAWDGLLRVELERRLGGMATGIYDDSLGAVENIPAQLHRVLFKPVKQKNILYAALDGDAKKNMQYLETALKRASLGRSAGSQTAAREEIKASLKGGVVQKIRDIFKAPITTMVETGEYGAFNKRVRNLAEALYNPEYRIRMAKIRKKHPSSASAGNMFLQLLNDIGEMTDNKGDSND